MEPAKQGSELKASARSKRHTGILIKKRNQSGIQFPESEFCMQAAVKKGSRLCGFYCSILY